MFETDPVTVGVTLTVDILRLICPHTNWALLNSYVPFLQKSMAWADVSTPLRGAHFTSQLGYETAWYGKMIEDVSFDPKEGNSIHIPFDKYELGTFPELDAAGHSIARRLGNTEKGDGSLFFGRGWPMITGRYNYTQAGKDLSLDLVNHPELAALPENAAKLAAWFWTKKNLNVPADNDDCPGVTKLINGEENGLVYRQAALVHAKQGFGIAA